MSKHPDDLDARIDQVLIALRDTKPTPGFEARINHRIANATEARSVAPSPFAAVLNAVKNPRILFAGTMRYTSASTAFILVLTIISLTFFSQRHLHTTAQSNPLRSKPHTPTQSDSPARAYGVANNQTPQGPSLGSHNPHPHARVLTPAPPQQPDTIALAETVAPSRAAPPLPLTPQEQLILSAMRPGQPIQVAELDIARAPALRAAAQAREDAAIQRYVRTVLAPFAVADELQPTTDSQPQEISTLSPAPQSPLSN